VPGPDHQRPLTDRGTRQALSLAQALAPLDIRVLLTSPALRCRQTLEPLAAMLALPVTDEPLLLPEADPGQLVDLLTESNGTGDLVVCSHAETLNRLFAKWATSPPRDRTPTAAPPRVPPGSRTAPQTTPHPCSTYQPTPRNTHRRAGRHRPPRHAALRVARPAAGGQALPGQSGVLVWPDLSATRYPLGSDGRAGWVSPGPG
jgi:phosphohistidine phosphatase SixA